MSNPIRTGRPPCRPCRLAKDRPRTLAVACDSVNVKAGRRPGAGTLPAHGTGEPDQRGGPGHHPAGRFRYGDPDQRKRTVERGEITAPDDVLAHPQPVRLEVLVADPGLEVGHTRGE